MRARVHVSVVLISLAVIAIHLAKRDTRAQQALAASDPEELVEHGQYVVHHVAMCVYCHSPRSEAGVVDVEQLLQGAPMPVESPFEGQRWAFLAPRLAGLPGGYSEADVIKFLQAGETPTGRTPLPPMPPFRMTERDASAVAAYLKSLQ
jgi:mono/diheme cytochrome c family protein